MCEATLRIHDFGTQEASDGHNNNTQLHKQAVPFSPYVLLSKLR